jgi:phosphoserine phosphatase RsbU/P
MTREDFVNYCMSCSDAKGHHVITATSGQQGIELLRRERPHVTILDCEMDGLAVLRDIRAVDLQAPVIMLSGAGHMNGSDWLVS